MNKAEIDALRNIDAMDDELLDLIRQRKEIEKKILSKISVPKGDI